jgi:hypothetical protein
MAGEELCAKLISHGMPTTASYAEKLFQFESPLKCARAEKEKQQASERKILSVGKAI